MDYVLDYADDLVLDKLYSQIPWTSQWQSTDLQRQLSSLMIIVMPLFVLMYFTFASLSFLFLYDRKQMQHPRFLKNQIRQEIVSTMKTVVPTTFLTALWFLGEIRGHSQLYDRLEDFGGWPYLVVSVAWFLFFTDMCIYWIHRALHHPLLYARLHKPHHKWIIPTPFASHAFHFFDGYLQSLPYHIFAFLFPLHKVAYLVLFVFVNLWTVSIHDGEYFTKGTVINSAAHHTIHHVYFNYNYGQYFTFWDRIGGTYREPTEEQFNRAMRSSEKTRSKESESVETFETNLSIEHKQKLM